MAADARRQRLVHDPKMAVRELDQPLEALKLLVQFLGVGRFDFVEQADAPDHALQGHRLEGEAVAQLAAVEATGEISRRPDGLMRLSEGGRQLFA